MPEVSPSLSLSQSIKTTKMKEEKDREHVFLGWIPVKVLGLRLSWWVCSLPQKKSVLLKGGGGSSIKYSQLINSALTFLSLLISWSSSIVLSFGLLWLFLGINCWLAGCYNYWRTKSCFIQLSVWLHLLFSIRLMPPRNLLQTLL